MKISFHGASRTVTGSKHLLTLDSGLQLLMDCGLFQGMGPDTDDLNSNFGFDPAGVHALLLSHAHIDHTGLIPKLVKEGFNGKIYCTPATRDLTEILLYDSAEIQAHEAEHVNKRRAARNLDPVEPLYTTEDVSQALSLFETVPLNKWISLTREVSMQFTNTGHLVGSAAISLRIKEGKRYTRLFFSGDVGRYRSVLLQPPAAFPRADYIILESTYGDKRHDLTFNTIETLQQWIRKVCVEKGGKLVIPAFSVGRTQEVLYALNQLSLEKRLPELSYFVDSPLSQKATTALKKYTGDFNDRLQQVLAIDDDPFDFPGLKYVESVEDSRRLVDHEEPCVIISASGTADAGRVRHHLGSALPDSRNGVLFVGYCGPRSTGRMLLDGCSEIELFSDPCPVNAEVGYMPGLSAHGDTDDLVQFLSCQEPDKVRKVFLVHGEYKVQQDFAERLKLKGYRQVAIPAPNETVELRRKRRIEVVLNEAGTP